MVMPVACNAYEADQRMQQDRVLGNNPRVFDFSSLIADPKLCPGRAMSIEADDRVIGLAFCPGHHGFGRMLDLYEQIWREKLRIQWERIVGRFVSGLG